MQRDLTRQLRGVKSDIVSRVRPQLDQSAVAKAETDIRALSQRLSKARDAEFDAAGKVRVAELKLAEARQSGRAKASQLAAAEERLGAALRELTVAQRTTARASEQFATAQHQASRASADAQRSNRGLLSSLRGISLGFRQVDDAPLRRSLVTLAKVGAIATVAAGGIAALGSSVPAVLSLASALAAVAGAAGLIPAALGAGGLALGTGVVGLIGLVDAFKPETARQAASSAASLAAARRAADRAAVQGAEQVRSAEQALARAQQSAQDAQVALTRARKDAAEQLEDLRLSLAGAALDERAAELGLRRAREQLAQAQAAGATGLDLDEAVLSVDQANQALVETRERYADLRVEAAAAQKAGVDGAENVIAAQRQVTDATQGVQDAQRELASAQRDAAQAQQDAALAIEQSQQRIADTVPTQLAPSALAFVAAVKALGPAFTAARLDVQERLFAGVAEHVAILGRRYLPVLRAEFAGVAGVLNRSGRDVASFFETDAAVADTTAALGNMRAGLDASSKAAVPLAKAWNDIMVVGSTFLPGIGRGVAGLAEDFAGFIGSARQSGRLAGWIQGGLDRLTQLRDLALNVGSILGSVFGAAIGAGADLLTTLRDLTGELATVLRSPQGQQGLHTFFTGLRGLVDAVKPGLRVVAGALVGLLLTVVPLLPKLGQAFSTAASSFAPLLAGLSWLATHVLPFVIDGLRDLAPAIGPIAGLIGAVVLGVKAWTLAQTFLNVVLINNPVGQVITVIALLVTGIILAYQHSETFRRIVQGTWEGIQVAAAWAWRNVLKPTFEAIDFYVTKVVGPAVLWLWRNVAEPGFKAIGAVVSFVWDHALHPTFDAITGAVSAVADSFQSGVDRIGRVWSALRRHAADPVNFVIDAVYNRGILAIWNRVAGLVPGLDPLRPLPLIDLSGPGISRARGNQDFASGGIVPGYTPGRDVHTFYSPTAGVLELSGGEPVLRPEAGRVLGASWVHGVNAAARSGGTSGVRRYLGGFAAGGVLGRLEGVAEIARDWTVGLVTDPVGTIRRMFGDPAAQVRAALGASPWVDMLARMPARLVDAATGFLAGKMRGLFSAAPGGGAFSGAGNWPPRIFGRVSANTLAAADFVRRTFGIGNISTLGDRPNKSDHPWGKALDVMIPAWQDPTGIAKGNQVASWFVMHPQVFGTKYVIWRDRINSGSGWMPYVHPLGYTNNPTLQHRDHVHVSVLDQGGQLPPGWSTVYNGTRHPEPVLTEGQWSLVRQAIAAREQRPTEQRPIVVNGVERDPVAVAHDVVRIQAFQDSLSPRG